jgi:predicted RNA-binding protein with PUA-like domain
VARRYWLFKSEPNVFSIDDLARSPGRTTCWEGVRNYQARNMLRDEIGKGDGVLFYHSRVSPMAVVGTARVVREGYVDDTQFDRRSRYHDPRSDPENPRWYMVDIRLERKFQRPVTLEELRATPGLESMMLLRRGSRLSVQPVTAEEFRIVTKLGSRRSPGP